MSRIAMNFEELHAKAQEFSTESSEVQAMIQRLDNMISALRETWEGEASVAFEEQYSDVKPSIVALEELLETISGQLTSVANAVQEQDQAIASKFKL